MKLVKCRNGHVYDADKLAECPHCLGKLRRVGMEYDTYGRDQEDIATELTDSDISEKSKVSNRKNVGVLVVRKGNERGRAFLIYEGKNRIGRADNMEIALTTEDTVSRSGHAIIEYAEGKFCIYSVKPDRLVYVNDKSISKGKTLCDRDVIILGECELVFVRFDDLI